MSQRTSTRGSAITAAAVSAGILSILAAGFLTYITNEGRLTGRSHAWSQALHFAEAAAELGTAEFLYQYTQGGSGFTSGRGWTSLGGGSYTKTVSNFTSTAGTTIGHLTINATGIGTGSPQMTGIGTATSSIGGLDVSRAVRVGFATSSLFPMGIISKNNLTLNGNASIDSYDSADPTKSTGGLYDASKKQANGNVGTVSGAAGAISMNGNTDIYGAAATGAGGTASMTGNAQIGQTFVNGDRADTPAEAQTAGWLTDNFSNSPGDVSLPSGLGSAPSLGTINSTQTINGGDWQASQISLSGNRTVTINGTVRLYVTGSTSISGNARILINAGGSLEVYVAGSVSVAGNGVNNSATTPDKNMWYGLPSCTSWSMSGNADWTGTVYAPQAAVTCNGNGNASGAFVGDTITINGNGSYHFDEALSTFTGGSAGYSVASWQELRSSGGSWVP